MRTLRTIESLPIATSPAAPAPYVLRPVVFEGMGGVSKVNSRENKMKTLTMGTNQIWVNLLCVDECLRRERREFAHFRLTPERGDLGRVEITPISISPSRSIQCWFFL